MMACAQWKVACLLLMSTVTFVSGQNFQTCANQCYQDYVNQYNRVCQWGVICSDTNRLVQVYIQCYYGCFSTTTTTRRPQVQGCGISSVGRIEGGLLAKECEIPWAVVVKVGDTFCGGSILDANTVLTAGHCVYSTSRGVAAANTIRIKHGSSNQNRAKTAYVSRVTVHHDFVLSTYDYDVAILTLTQNLVLDGCTRPICLPSVNAALPNSMKCEAAGWGALSYTQLSSQQDLRKVELPIVPLNTCQRLYGGSQLVSDIKMCAGDINNGGIDSCLGDSGGPLMCYVQGAYFLYGVVSFGNGCGDRRYPGVYARVTNSNINGWIRANM